MKRALAILLAAITALLCACGRGTAAETTAAPTTEATTVATTVETTEPEPEYIYVDITMDNWQEYFTLSEEPIPIFEGDDFQSFDVTLSLNEQYRDRAAINEAFGDSISLLGEEIVVEVNYEQYQCKIEVDAENQAVTKIMSSASPSNQTELHHLNDISFRSYSGDGFTTCLIKCGSWKSYRLGGGNTDAGYYYPEKYEITSISGTLPLLAE